jgi:uncharacterized protein YndB with AHSA1/START domain
MNEVAITDQTTIDAPIAAVWEAIQTPAAHARWYQVGGVSRRRAGG